MLRYFLLKKKLSAMNKKTVLSLFAVICFFWAGSVIAQDSKFATQLATKEGVSKKSDTIKPRPAPGFSLKDLDGKEVSLEDLKGKVVVLDFWATWCAPCIKSFPAMQMAVDKYKEDPEVAFLFINTWERQEDPAAAVKQFMDRRGFNFTVLMDKKDPVSKRNPVVESYNVTGIPVKFIIDADGNIRHKLTGFMGGDNQAHVEELTALIESSKK